MGKRYSPEQIVRKLRDAEAKLSNGSSVPEVSRELGISEATFHRWRKKYAAMSSSEAKRLKELEKENARLKKLVAEQVLDIDILGGESGKLLSPARRRKAVEHVQKKLNVSERRACRAIGQPRSTQRYVGRQAERDRGLADRIIVLSRGNPRYGYRRVWALLRREGWADPKSSARSAVWARVRTATLGGGPSTKTTYGATISRWTKPRTGPQAEDDASGGRVHQRVPIATGEALDHC